jgi:hypothetical protein
MAKHIIPPSHRKPGARAGATGGGRTGAIRPGGRATPAPGSGQPVFAQPTPSPDPSGFKDPVTDQSERDVAGVQPVPQPSSSGAEPILMLATIYGSQGASVTQTIQQSGQIVFHAVGDTGSAEGPTTQSLVADKMVSDFTETNRADVPSFFYHLGDLVYYFGEATYYYDQFYEPYRLYPGPIVGIPGNHDGIVYPGDPAPSLAGFLANFCTAAPAPAPDAGGLVRTTMTQPGVYYTFEAPFVRILGVYTNVLEDPGVISDQSGTYPTLDQRQITFLTTALERVKSDNFTGAVIIATHHPPFSGGSEHGGSPLMLQDIDSACTAAGVWPHAVLSGHVHNYQRFTRVVNAYQIPYLVAGCGGHAPLVKMSSNYRTPYPVDSTLTLESYDDTDYGYLRIVVNAQTMTIEFHPQHDGGTTKTPDDTVTVELASRTISG